MSAKPGSVLYVLASDGSFTTNRAQESQLIASEHHLPLAFVYCIEQELLEESELAKYLSGVEGLSHHVIALQIFTHQSQCDRDSAWAGQLSVIHTHGQGWLYLC